MDTFKMLKRLRDQIYTADDMEEYYRAGIAAADEIERLRAALEPFIQAAETIRHEVRDETTVAYIAYDLAPPGRKSISLLAAADFRAAKAAVSHS